MDRHSLIARLWSSDAWTHTEKSVLTVAILGSDPLGIVRMSQRDIARMAGMHKDTVRRTLPGLVHIGVLHKQQSSDRRSIYRLVPSAISLAAIDGTSTENGVRARPGRFDVHRMKLSQVEASRLLHAAERRLIELDDLLASDRLLKPENHEEYLRLIKERDDLAEEVIPSMQNFLRTYA